jgi:hypothetical protein
LAPAAITGLLTVLGVRSVELFYDMIIVHSWVMTFLYLVTGLSIAFAFYAGFMEQ